MAGVDVTDLQQIELLAGFDAEELQEFAANVTSRDCAAGEQIVSLGDESRALFLILEGRVQIELVGRLVEETLLAELGPKDVFGESTFFHSGAHHTTVRALEPTRLAVLEYASYEALLKRKSAVAYHLGANAAHILAARLQATDRWLQELLDYDEQIHRRDLREQYFRHFRPTFSTPHGYVGLGVNW
jgi:CRP-like cAMP-binding protein